MDDARSRRHTKVLSKFGRLVGRLITFPRYLLEKLVTRLSAKKKPRVLHTERRDVEYGLNEDQIVESKGCIDGKSFCDQSTIRTRDKRIEELQNHVRKLEVENTKQEQKVQTIQLQLSKQLDIGGSYVDGLATPFLLEGKMKSLQVAIDAFVKVFQNQRSKLEENITGELRDYYRGAYLSRPGHVKYMLKARLYEIFFKDFENESFLQGGATLFLDIEDRKTRWFQSFETFDVDVWADTPFRKFCVQKMHDFMSCWKVSELSAYDKTMFCQYVSKGGLIDPDTSAHFAEEQDTLNIFKTFVGAAKAVWSLHKLTNSFEPRAEVFRVESGIPFHEEFMKTVESKEEDAKFVSKVGFMVCPGFRLRKLIFQCLIYLASVEER